MEVLEKICVAAANNPNVLSFTEIGQALAAGAIAGHKTGMPAGALTGAVLNLSLEVGDKVVLITQSMLHSKSKLNNKT